MKANKQDLAKAGGPKSDPNIDDYLAMAWTYIKTKILRKEEIYT